MVTHSNSASKLATPQFLNQLQLILFLVYVKNCFSVDDIYRQSNQGEIYQSKSESQNVWLIKISADSYVAENQMIKFLNTRKMHQWMRDIFSDALEI